MNGEGIGNVSRIRLLDSFALLAYLNKESGFEKVRDVLAKAQESGSSVLMNEINVGETYYILAGLPIATVPNAFEDVIDAARIKAQYPLAFEDCFAVATALREEAVIMTGDPEFKKVEHHVDIDWLHR